MNAIKSIERKTFIKDLEFQLQFEQRLTFEHFTTQLWQLLCRLSAKDKIRLANQLKFENNEKRTNIGNLNLYIIKRLRIDFMNYNYYN